MKISLKNIGMLDSAEFEVGELSLICGENNTGKTYATYSLYGFLDFMRNIQKNTLETTAKDFDKMMRNMDKYKKLKDSKIDIQIDDVVKLSFEEIKEKFEASMRKKEKIYVDFYLNEMLAGKRSDFLDSTFSINFITLDKLKQSIKTTLNNIPPTFNSIFKFDINEEFLTITIVDLYKDKKESLDIYIHQIFEYILINLLPEHFILSVERTGAAIFREELDFISLAQLKTIKELTTQARIKLLNMEEEVKEKQELYPKPVRDNIDFIRNIKQIAKKESMFKKEKEKYKEIFNLLAKILGGKYKATDAGILFQPKKSKKAYNIEISSSSVRSLLMLNYYILHIAQPNQILMIDEPELNLHPKNQILVARLLVLLVNAGVKVFITTHSDYIVREFSNCIMLNNLSDKQIANLEGYTKELKLESNKVRAYIAENKKGKNVLDSIKIDSKQGIFMKTFDEPIDTQNENQGLIFEEVLKSENLNE
ncbi:AAA family ATPase [Helicobacter saguini]|uniref:AAA family ATPase n=1 Tax=Helicobacter saguini TaxID=1548018 RepID=A0A347VS73_9HELI|nr:AAA family ATPase [Helicobacter saguini]MWV62626.1 AAA family ATPase [Helicobacter saguini]MWV66702.1 AAA family ATPase [Helicobacter saguini]MWV69052.1 AAA family ATPase [Helicobacter saguini]MWV71394.1 AAA family ATPase [Helicobacter saguini]TLD94024.1 hypothetical protein LS64_007660 [Helicobacter saguini]